MGCVVMEGKYLYDNKDYLWSSWNGQDIALNALHMLYDSFPPAGADPRCMMLGRLHFGMESLN